MHFDSSAQANLSVGQGQRERDSSEPSSQSASPSQRYPISTDLLPSAHRKHPAVDDSSEPFLQLTLPSQSCDFGMHLDPSTQANWSDEQGQKNTNSSKPSSQSASPSQRK